MCTFSFICENDLFICDIILFSHAKITSGIQSIPYENVEFACKKHKCYVLLCHALYGHVEKANCQ